MSSIEAEFLRNQLIPLAKSIPADKKPTWGKMNPQQMIEHLCDAVDIADGHLVLPLATPEEQLPAYYQFLLSEKPFRENTRNPILPEEPLPVRYDNLDTAIQKLEKKLHLFFEAYDRNPDMTPLHPIFGKLNFAGHTRLLYKHSKHHLRQFGVED